MKPLSLVTGASTGIGYELTKRCARYGFDLVIAADDPAIHQAAQELRNLGAAVEAVEADLATLDGVDRCYEQTMALNRPVEVLVAHARCGFGEGFLEQDMSAIMLVVNRNITGIVALLHKVGRDMRQRGNGRILVTGCIAGFVVPGIDQAVHNGTTAFLDSFSLALRHELRDSGVSITSLMLSDAENELAESAKVIRTTRREKAAHLADVAERGFQAMMRGEDEVATGWHKKLRTIAHATPANSQSRPSGKRSA